MSNVTLIGMPGCGKSTLGVLLAKILLYQFVDTDLLIQQKAGAPLRQILSEQGNSAFSVLENQVIGSLCAERTVIATGGSAVYCQEAMTHLKQMSKLVYINISYEEMARRVGDYSARGIVLREGMDLRAMYEERLPLYRKAADIEFVWEKQSASEAATKIAGMLQVCMQ
ncbi:MAG: shikimate kinase [Clostridiales bacterium]|nr:shikimate kinase [Clostridiales bacterium]